MKNHINFYDLIKPRVKQITSRWGISFCFTSAWIGSHYSTMNRRLCLQIIPFIAIYFNHTNYGLGTIISVIINTILFGIPIYYI